MLTEKRQVGSSIFSLLPPFFSLFLKKRRGLFTHSHQFIENGCQTEADMKIVILDGYTTNPGDLSWDCIASLGELVVNDRTAQEEIPSRIGDAEIVFVNDYALGEAELAGAEKLRYIGVLATGYNGIDLTYTRSRGITVTNVPAYSTHSVAQFTIALLLEAVSHVGEFNTRVHGGDWVTSADPSFYIGSPLTELYGKKLGIIGLGSIGSEVASIARAFGMEVIAYHPAKAGQKASTYIPYVSLEEFFASSDIISLHAPLREGTRGIIGTEALSRMKEGVIIINTSRGALLDEYALRDALLDGKVSFACVDVLSKEPMVKDHPLLGIPTCIITPHVAWAPVESRSRLIDRACANLKSYLAGKPVNVVT